MNIREKMAQGFLFSDGGTGSVLQGMGLTPGQPPELWNLEYPQRIVALHRAYLEAGCHMVSTNTFGVNRLRFGDQVQPLVAAAIANARQAIAQVGDNGSRYVALDIGPCGKLLKPLGSLDFEEAVEIFAQVVRAGRDEADVILIETMNDAYETKAAVLAAKENCDLPIFVTNVYDETHKLMTGADPMAMVALLEGLGVDALGMNCSLGPEQMLSIVPELVSYASVPVMVVPNAGLPRSENGQTVYDVSPEEFAKHMKAMAGMGVRILGGCCGTTPAYMAEMIRQLQDVQPSAVTAKSHTIVSSYTHGVEIGPVPVMIGERINPTGKKRLKEALRAGDVDYILQLAMEQEAKGVQLLDVNVGLPELDEPAVLTDTMMKLQEVTALPLQLDSSDPEALERAMRRYNGKPLVNSVNGKQECMRAVFPLVQKYGGVLIALTLDEDGIPSTAEGRVRIARRILDQASTYGIGPKDIVFDPLALTVSAEPDAAAVTLEAVRRIGTELGCKTSLGVSNISFGLPQREAVTSAFFAMALQNGLSAAIMNPMSEAMLRTYYSARVLCQQDPNCTDYVAFMQNAPVQRQVAGETEATVAYAVEKGLKSAAAQAAKKALETLAPMDVINKEIIPALDKVGQGFEQKTVFLPQLLMCAEAASAAFGVIRQALAASGSQEKKEKVILATVKGDIHDIGKNIVRVLLENYGYQVIDLGKDVPPETVVDRAEAENVRLVGLSALMTTTVPSMEETIRQLKARLPDCQTVVGGAVLTKDYADAIGADFYAKDAMETVRLAERIFAKD